MEPINNASDILESNIDGGADGSYRAAINQVVLRVIPRQGSVHVNFSAQKSHAL